MEREDDSDPIPIDMVVEILSRSSDKSIARFLLASKFYASILSGPDFTKLFLSRSSSTRQPRLLFAINYYAKWSIYSSPQPQNPDANHSLVVPADLRIKFLGDVAQKNICSLVSGLLYFPNMRKSKEATEKVPIICNPSTGQYAGLPQPRSKSVLRSFLGYDPIGKQYKVLSISNGEVNILTLGTMAWRKIKCPEKHYHVSEGICINGVLYYIDGKDKGVMNLGCFDVRYEKLWFHEVRCNSDWVYKLINYNGKLGLISWHPDKRLGNVLAFNLWILKDAQIKKFSHKRYHVPVNIVVKGDVSVVGATANGEIILSMDYTSNPFFIFYLNPERNTLERVRIQGFETPKNHSRVYTFVDYAEDLNLIEHV